MPRKIGSKSKKPHRKQPGSTYNGGAPRVSLTNLSPFHHNLAKRLWNKRSECLKLGRPFDLDIDWVLQQVPVCAVTGANLITSSGYEALTPAIDQIIPGAGYTKINVRIVANWYNNAKNQWDDKAIKRLILGASDHIRAVKNEE